MRNHISKLLHCISLKSYACVFLKLLWSLTVQLKSKAQGSGYHPSNEEENNNEKKSFPQLRVGNDGFGEETG